MLNTFYYFGNFLHTFRTTENKNCKSFDVIGWQFSTEPNFRFVIYATERTYVLKFKHFVLVQHVLTALN